MTTTLTTMATEKATYVVTVSFTDEAENVVTPNPGLAWTLTDINGTVINNRAAVPIASASTIYIVLSDDDLSLTTGVGVRRVVTVEGTYNSTRGTDLPLKQQATFDIEDLVAVS